MVKNLAAILVLLLSEWGFAIIFHLISAQIGAREAFLAFAGFNALGIAIGCAFVASVIRGLTYERDIWAIVANRDVAVCVLNVPQGMFVSFPHSGDTTFVKRPGVYSTDPSNGVTITLARSTNGLPEIMGSRTISAGEGACIYVVCKPPRGNSDGRNKTHLPLIVKEVFMDQNGWLQSYLKDFSK